MRAASTPRKRTVRYRMQLAFGIAREPERREQRRLLAEQLTADELADADHLEAMIRVGDHVHVVAKAIEHRKTVRREATDPARRLVAIDAVLSFETFLTERERRGPHVGEIVGDDELRRLRTIGIDAHDVGVAFDICRHRAALHTVE